MVNAAAGHLLYLNALDLALGLYDGGYVFPIALLHLEMRVPLLLQRCDELLLIYGPAHQAGRRTRLVSAARARGARRAKVGAWPCRGTLRAGFCRA